METLKKIFIQHTAAPHRVFLALSAGMSLIAIAWWTLVWLLGKTFMLPHPVSLNALHLFLIFYYVFTPVILGFLLTVFPYWFELPFIGKRFYLSIWSLYITGLLSSLTGLFFIKGLMIFSCMVFSCIFLLVSLYWHWGWAKTKAAKFNHLTLTLLIFYSGFALSTGFLFYFLGHTWLYPLIRDGMIFFFLNLTVLCVAYVMVPVFTEWSFPHLKLQALPTALFLWTFCALFKVWFSFVNHTAGLMVCDAFMLITVLYQFRLWKFLAPKPDMLTLILYIALFWYPVSLALSLSHLSYFLLTGIWNPFWHNAALHALTIGCFSTILIGMMTRVTLGHSGRELKTDRMTNLIFILFQLVVVLRLLPAALPQQARWLYVSSGLLWIICFAAWNTRYISIYFKPRIDGEPG